ncbi:MAG: hypothetical protein VKI93_00595 [Synechococcus sp.]|nr:hypothetical protein [Synechococcus sp.]
MGYKIAVGSESGTFRDLKAHDDLDDAMTTLNELINQRDWQLPDSYVALFDTKSGQKMAQYALQDFNYRTAS